MGKTLLIQATHLRDYFIVGLLLEHGADATICDELGRTAEDWSHISGHLETANLVSERTACTGSEPVNGYERASGKIYIGIYIFTGY